MMKQSVDAIKKELETRLSKKRYQHSLAVAESARYLALKRIKQNLRDWYTMSAKMTQKKSSCKWQKNLV